MTQTFLFEELDSGTREYLTAVRGAEGDGAPGIFAFTNTSLAGCGCATGLALIAFTLVATLTSVLFGLVYKEPGAVAMLQTAGLLLGGWLVIAWFRSAGKKGSRKQAGHWVYIDALHIYEAKREQVKVARLNGMERANCTPNYNNGTYQNSIIRVQLGDKSGTSFTITGEAKAEQMVVFLNYVSWARGAEGGERAALPPAVLGGLAKYVATNDVEPKDHENKLNLSLVEPDITAVPEEPTREGHAFPPIIPYFVILLAGIGIFFAMWKSVNPPVRDDAIFEAITTEPVQPEYLRAFYLRDERNQRHRKEVLEKLAGIYNTAINHVNAKGQDAELRDGLAKVLESLKDVTSDPLVSLKVSELNAKEGAADRVKNLRDGLVGGVEKQNGTDINRGGILGELARAMPTSRIDNTPIPDLPPIGLQLIEFSDKPEDAEHAHFEITYEFVPIGKSPLYALNVTVEVRTKLDGDPVATYTEKLKDSFPESQFGDQAYHLKNRLLRGFIGAAQEAGDFPPGRPVIKK